MLKVQFKSGEYSSETVQAKLDYSVSMKYSTSFNNGGCSVVG